MPVADFAPPRRIQAGGGPSTPDARVLLALATPVIGQFDPAFTAIMDEVMQLARAALLTSNTRCYPVTGTASAGLEALLNTLLVEGDRVTVEGSPAFAARVSVIVRACGGQPAPGGRFSIVPHLDPDTGVLAPLDEVAAKCHAAGSLLIVEATMTLGGVELRTDDWRLDAVVAGVDHCVGAPAGMALVTYTDELEGIMHQRPTAPATSYLDLLQLQAYWSADRLNHHTAPTSLVYGLREALRLLDDEGLEARWERHRHASAELSAGLEALGVEANGDSLVRVARVPRSVELRRELLDNYGVSVHAGADDTWRIGLLGADAQPTTCRIVLAALAAALGPGSAPA